MNYNDLQFWVALAICITICVLLKSIASRLLPQPENRLDLYLLALTSCSLFFFCDKVSFIIFITEVFVTYILLKAAFGSSRKFRRLFAALNIVIIVSVLGWYKYAHFFLSDVFGIDMSLYKFVIPVGISFYSFQLIAFIIDTTGQTKPLPRNTIYLNFLSFFPQIVAGPIERAKWLVPQISKFTYALNADRFLNGFPIVVLGLFYKFVLADNFAAFIDLQPKNNAYQIWLSLVLFSQRIYFDFAGYSLISVGCGKFFGVNLSYNFLSPYMASNIQDFWRKWNVTLLQWFRDYLYIPLGGGRKLWWPANIMLVWIISGFWHGAGYNFLLWGGVHGIFLVTYRLVGRRLPVPIFIGRILTNCVVVFSWLFFCESRFPVLMTKLATIFTPSDYATAKLFAAINQFNFGDLLPLLATTGLAVLVYFFEYKKRHEEIPYAGMLNYAFALLLLSLTVMLSAGNTPKFIYFSF